MKPAQILIIDKVGLIGEPLYLKLSKEFSVVFVSQKPSANVPFSRKFPIIPDSKYSYMIVIASEGIDLEFLPKTIEKARSINSNFIFVQGISYKDKHLVGKVLSMYSSSKVVLHGDIFDSKLVHAGENLKSTINKFIYQAQRFGKIQVMGDGLKETYPVSLADVVDRIIDLIFGLNKRHSLFYIFPKHPPTELSLAHMIQRANPEITIDFVGHDSREISIPFPPNGENLLGNKYQLAKKIKNVEIKKNELGEKEQEGKSPEKIKRLKNFPLFVIWIFIFLLLSPLVFTLSFSFLGLNTLYFAKTQLDKRNLSNVKSSLHLSNTFFNIGKKASDVLYLQLNFIGREDNLRRLLEDINLGRKMSEGALQAFNSGAYFSKVLAGKSKDPIGDFTKGKNNLKSAIVGLERIKAEGKAPAPFIEKIKNIDPFIKLLSNTADVMPSIVGLDGQKTYLILLQNNMELRPGGGFIGSYGILKFNMGKIRDFSIYDVYDADEQLKGHVEPPFAIRRYLPSVHWYLRDSNFDVDFVKSASASSNFLYIETGQEVSGVIAADLTFVKNILHAIRPVYVPDYKETVDTSNLYMLTQTHSEKNFFPESRQKKDFLRSLYKAIITRIFEEGVGYFEIAQAISDSLSQKHLVFGLNNNIQNIFTVNGWSSSLWDERKNGKKSVNDFLGINEANLGVNKVNYYISRNIKHEVTVKDNGKILEELNISYKNTSAAWPGGDYKNYLRIVLPLDTPISEISINDIPQSVAAAVTDFQIYEDKNFKPPRGLEVEKINQDKKTIYGLLVNVPVEKLVKVKIKYEFPGSISGLNSFSYNLKLFKQPGIDSLPYSFSLEFPSKFNVISTTDGINREGGKVMYSEKIVEDKNLIINFAGK